MNPKLKPLNHKQVSNSTNIKPIVTSTSTFGVTKSVLGKPNQNPIKPQTLTKKSSNGPVNQPLNNQQQPSRQIKTPMKMQRTSNKKIEMYDDCDDFDCQLQDNNNIKYFQGQLQKNIKQEAFVSTKKQPQNKALIVLPKLQSEIKVKGTKDLQKQIDMEMSRIYDKEGQDHLY